VGQGDLMAIQQTDDGRWKVDVEPIKGKRFRKTFKTKGEAQRFEATCRAKVIENREWSPSTAEALRAFHPCDNLVPACVGADHDQATERAGRSCTPAYLRQSLHPERRQHPHATEDPGPFELGHDDAVRASGARSSAGCGTVRAGFVVECHHSIDGIFHRGYISHDLGR